MARVAVEATAVVVLMTMALMDDIKGILLLDGSDGNSVNTMSTTVVMRAVVVEDMVAR